MTDIRTSTGGRNAPVRDEAINVIVEALGRLRFGAINLTVHEGKLVQVDITERKRFQS
ncbi:MAG: YezD family protein [Chakrabartia godavariana]